MRLYRLLTFTVMIFTLISLSSCFATEEVEGSYDISDEHETGPSDLTNSLDAGFNVAMNFTWGFSGSTPGGHINNVDRGYFYGNDGIYSNDMQAGGGTWMPSAPAAGSGQYLWVSKLQLIQKGSKFESNRTKLNYFEAGQDIQYQYTYANQSAIFGGLGPYIAYGIGGNVKGPGFKEPAFGGTDGYKRFDAGLHLVGGYRLPSALYLSVAYEYGLVNKSPAPDFTSRNRTFSIAVGYPLDKIFKGLAKSKGSTPAK